MRMVHYYLALGIVQPFLLLGTLVTGVWNDGSERHLGLGLVTAIFCVAVNTLLIMFMIVTGRVLKLAVATRDLSPHFLGELNAFFAKKRAYPVALLAATAAAVTAVLGHGRFIGVPMAVHIIAGIVMILLNLFALEAGYRSLRSTQDLLDRAARELDRLDRESTPEELAALPDGGPVWSVGWRARWLIMAAAFWLPYVYWGMVVWRGDFGRVPLAFPILTAVASAVAALRAFDVTPDEHRSRE